MRLTLLRLMGSSRLRVARQETQLKGRCSQSLCQFRSIQYQVHLLI